MKKAELVNVFKYLVANYTDWEKKMSNNENSRDLLELWYSIFKDTDVNLFKNAVLTYINSSKYPPTIADIQEIIYKTTHNDKTAIERWNEAFDCICNGNYYAEQCFENASPIVQRFFGSPRQIRELAMTDSDTVNTVVKGQFLKQYELLKTSDKEQKTFPQEIKAMISNLSNRMSLGE